MKIDRQKYRGLFAERFAFSIVAGLDTVADGLESIGNEAHIQAFDNFLNSLAPQPVVVNSAPEEPSPPEVQEQGP